MFRSLFVLALLSTFIFGCGTRSIAIYEAETPSFNLESFFSGKVDGWGIVLNRNNDVVKRFKVNVEGYCTADKSSGKLVEKFLWSDGKREERVWNLKKLQITNGEKLVMVSSVPHTVLLQGMFLVEDDVLMNRAVFSKFGLKLGTVIITFKKSNG